MTDQNFSDAPQPAPEQSFEVGDLRDVFVDSVESIELGEDGSLDMKIVSEPEYDDGYDYGTPDQPAAVEVQPELTQDTPSAPQHDWEKRYNDLQPEFTKVTQQNAELRERLDNIEGMLKSQATSKPRQDEFGYDDYGQPDPQAFEQQVSEITKAVLDEALQLYVPQDMVKQWRANSEVQEALNAHEDFTEMLPHIESVYNRFPEADMTVEQAYQLAKFAVESVQGQGSHEQPAAPVVDTPATTPSEPHPSPEELYARSQRLQTAEGHSVDGSWEPEEVVKTPRDAIAAAIRDLEESS